MEKYITDERTGFQYELVGDYYLLAGEDEPEVHSPIGIWGKEHFQFIKNHRQLLFYDLLLSGKLNKYLADIDKQAEETFTQLIDDMAKSEGVTEKLKAENQMEWVRRMNNIQSRAREIVNREIIYA